MRRYISGALIVFGTGLCSAMVAGIAAAASNADPIAAAGVGLGAMMLTAGLLLRRG